MNNNLITDRMILKSISKEDRDFIFSEFSDTIITKYLFDEEPLTKLEEADEIIDTYLHPKHPGLYRWILVRKTDNTKMGTCGFHCWNSEEGSIEMGYDLQEDFWGKGYMQEALKEIISFGMDELHLKVINAHIYHGNLKSIALTEKLGFINSEKEYNYTFRGRDYLHQVYALDCAGV
ncbi:MAG: GCN5-related N-acetyltransferase [Clostridiales bacterium]|jgi:ribosomal-protein-alanine N-acetyltransferase|nr:GCN5-related N-acetyltransferase [Clostridiales bacterium]